MAEFTIRPTSGKRLVVTVNEIHRRVIPADGVKYSNEAILSDYKPLIENGKLEVVGLKPPAPPEETKHEIPEGTVEEPQLSCPYCGEEYKTERWLNRHIKKMHKAGGDEK